MPMSFSSGHVYFVKDAAGWPEFTESEAGVVGQDLVKRGRTLATLARGAVGKRTGRLAASIHSTYVATPNPFVMVGSDLSYAEMVHEGTRPHLILPRYQKLLRFSVNGRIVYARKVVHPGTRPTKYLSRFLPGVVQ